MHKLDELISLERPLIGLDLETTGPVPKTARIVELGLEIMRPGQPTKEYRTLVNPGEPIPPEATKVHNITDEMVADAPTFAQLADNLLTGLTDCDYVGYSVRYDLQVMQLEFERAGKRWSYEDASVIDAHRVWQTIEGRSLNHAIERWLTGKQLDVDGEAHTALRDVKMATRVVAAQLHQCPQLPRDPKRLHDLCWPDWFDSEGKLRWRDGELVMGFGQHKGKPMREVPRGYFRFMISKDFSAKVKGACEQALKGVFLSNGREQHRDSSE